MNAVTLKNFPKWQINIKLQEISMFYLMIPSTNVVSTSQIHLFGICTYPIHHYLDTTTGEHKQKKAGENDLGVEFVGKKTLAFGCNII